MAVRTLAGALVLAIVAGCAPSPDARLEVDRGRAVPGQLRSIERVGGYPGPILRLLVWWSGFSDEVPVEHGITLYRVEYWTTGPDAERTWASGLIAFPRTDTLLGVVSYQHGTTTRRDGAPSTPTPDEGLLSAAIFAGRGYLLVAPDYFGLGTSPDPHPYLHAESAATAVVDLLKAARGLVGERGLAWPDALFLTGFSQGGHATLAAHRTLEASPVEGLHVTASAPVAGPFDLAGLSFPFSLEGKAHAASMYLAYMTVSYARIYGEPLTSVVRDPYAALLPRLFDGAHPEEEVIEALPARPREMYQSDFLEDYDSGRETWLLRRLAENSLYDWKPRAPIRLYYGTRDVDVSPEEARREAARLSSEVRAIDVGALDHNESVIAAVPMVRAWFDSLTAHAGEGGE